MKSMWQVLARIARIQPRIDAIERKTLIETGIRLGVALATGKPANQSYHDYAQAISEQASGAYPRLLATPPPPAHTAPYEPPDKHTGPSRPVNPEHLKRLIGTSTLPAIPGDLVRKYREQRRREHDQA